MTPRMYKFAQAKIPMDHPMRTAYGISEVIKFLMHRAPKDKRDKILDTIKNKIRALSPASMSSKKSPQNAIIGHSITFVKTVLN
jgi:hypothetical protein